MTISILLLSLYSQISNNMKAAIHITGQIGGNHKLLSALSNGNYRKGMFNSFFLEFNTIGEAKKAIKEGWKYLKSIDDNHTFCDGPSKDGKTLYFDASSATITTHNLD